MPALSEQIEIMIATGKFSSGDRLPAERQLAVELGVSRSSLREAIKQLVSCGLLISRRGGGTYVTSPEAAEPVRAALLPLAPLARSEGGYWRDVMEIRKSLEGDVAAFAALRASAEDKARISTAYDVLNAELFCEVRARNPLNAPATLAKLDTGFHMAIARAAHNVVLYQVMTGLEGLLEASISGSLAKLYQLPGTPDALNAQHRHIMEAILAGRAEDARTAAIEHLLFVEDRLKRIEDDAARMRRSSHAFQHIGTIEETLS